MKNFRFARDKWLSQEFTWAKKGPITYDKLQHFIGGIFLFALGALIHPDFGLAFSMAFWFLWEVKDGLIPWESMPVTTWPLKYNWGGDGFSWRDMIAAWAGAILCYIFI